ncbi:hypothetical protein IFT92_15405 [Peribacillus simplex]|uniref:hypothetical protein n=1 Tax=Peribacillus simplex TaxID=1478 RepID=UPI001924A739|nr:hypothetical protein [Peribacillus simplex]MBD8589187.1 hypothetical protein [Peribacillus simplex]
MLKELSKVLNIKWTICIIIFIIIVPIIINYFLLTWRFTGIWFIPGVQGNYDDWLGYFSNYSGGIIGGIVAFLIAWSQIKSQAKEKEIEAINAERKTLLKVQYELKKIKYEFDSLKMAEIEDETVIIPQVSLDIRELNPTNWADLGELRNAELFFELMEIEDFYKQFRKDLLNDIFDLEITKGRIEDQLNNHFSSNDKRNWKLEEESIRIGNTLLVLKRSREYYWVQFREKRDKINEISENLEREIIKINEEIGPLSIN